MAKLTSPDDAANAVRPSLLIVTFSLVFVGLLSGTMVRHLLQILPLAVAFWLLSRSASRVGAYAAVALFVFWFAILVLIWLYLLGISNIASGSYTLAEILFTIAIALGCLSGALAGARTGRSLAALRRVATLLFTWAVQVAVMLLSFSETFVNR